MRNVVAVIMAGGKGERLYPLTLDRSKPAVPFGGIYRIIDVTLSNCINSEVYRILVLPQYKSQSLTDHIEAGWNIFSAPLGHYLRIVHPQKRVGEDWYLGTADSVRQNLYLLKRAQASNILILSGDHVYKMDYSLFKAFHEEKGADLTIATFEIEPRQAKAFGIIEVNESGRIVGFEEKPEQPRVNPQNPDVVYASMGVYIFKADVLIRILEESTEKDFGKDILPRMIHSHSVFAYPYKTNNRIRDYIYTTEESGTRTRVLTEKTRDSTYWRDVGDLDAYWNANMDLTGIEPFFNLYGTQWPILTYQGTSPPAKMVYASETSENYRVGKALDSLVSPGCIISGGLIRSSVLSRDVYVHSWSQVEESVIMSRVEVGRHVKIKKAIVDKENRIPPGTVIGYDPAEDRKRFTVTPRGIVVVRKGYYS
ncbi:MAG: glucose-1-phosphate adenylyltransferase [Deltaproteobacteria bacterium]|nr:glucose-1-phosphate adenylyltransferase [Deltaproteobacteria bacterium]